MQNFREIKHYTREDGSPVYYPACLDGMVTLVDKVNKRFAVKHIRLIDVLTTWQYKDEVERIRAMDDEKEQKKAKNGLPAYCIAGEYETLVAGVKPLKTNPFTGLDIDADGNPHLNLLALKEAIAQLPYVAAVTTSARGKGLFVIALIEEPERGTDYYHAISKDLYTRLGVVTDKACTDVATRMRFVSFDQCPMFNPLVQSFKLEELPIACSSCNAIHKPAYTTDSTSVNRNYCSNLTDDYSRVLEVVKRLESEHRDITDVQREWFEIGQSLANTFGEDGRELYHRVSRLSPTKYTPDDCDRMFTRCLSYRQRSTLSIATFFYYAVKR